MPSQPGVGVMINLLGGIEGARDPKDFYGRTIKDAKLKDESIFHIKFTDGSEITLTDEGQSCCERRYITCDDDPKDLVGGVLRLIETRNGPDIPTEYEDCHETVFVNIFTEDGKSVSMTTHVEHNGYYGGFSLVLKEIKKASK